MTKTLVRQRHRPRHLGRLATLGCGKDGSGSHLSQLSRVRFQSRWPYAAHNRVMCSSGGTASLAAQAGSASCGSASCGSASCAQAEHDQMQQCNANLLQALPSA